MLSSDGILGSLEMSGGCLEDVWRMSGGIWVEIMEIWGARICRSVFGFPVLAVWSQNTNLEQPWKAWLLFVWPYWDIKIELKFRCYTLGPLCLWQCLYWVTHSCRIQVYSPCPEWFCTTKNFVVFLFLHTSPIQKCLETGETTKSLEKVIISRYFSCFWSLISSKHLLFQK